MYLYKGYEITLEDLFDDLEEDYYSTSYLQRETIEKAKNGDMDSIYDIGWYYDGFQTYATAMLWYKIAAAENLAKAQVRIGNLYERAEGVPRDYHAALEWYLKAAKQHDQPAFSEIGSQFYYGRGVPRDQHKAKEWFYKAGEYETDEEPSDDESNPRLKDTEKQKPIQDLIREAELFLVLGRLEKDKEQLSEDIERMRETQSAMEKEIKHENERIALLEDEKRSLLDALQKQRTEASNKISGLDEKVQQLVELLHGQKIDIKDKEL